MIKYRTSSYSNDIEEVEVVRETEQYIYLPWSGKAKERREQKSSYYNTYFDTRPAARAYLIERLEKSIAAAQVNIERDKADLEKLRSEKD